MSKGSTPFFPPSDPARRLLQGPPAKSKFLATPEMDEALRRLTAALKPDGTLYASFKLGAGEGYKSGRFFNDYDEPKLRALLARHPGLSVVKIWRTSDTRPTREHELWLNILVKKRAD